MKKVFLSLAVLTALFLLPALVDGQALTKVADKIATDATGAKTSAEKACKALCIIFIIVGIVGAAWKSTTEHNDGAKSWGKWLLSCCLIGIAFALVGYFI